MNIFKKIISAIIMISLFAGCAIVSFAYETDYDMQIFELKALGIIEGDESGSLDDTEVLTRAQFAAITVRLMNMEAIASSVKSAGFADVDDSHWAKTYIDFLSESDILHGTGKGMFEPEKSVTWQEAAKIFVNILGYGNSAIQKGGYPAGYAAQAGSVGLLDGVDLTKEPMPRSEVFKMAYNALDINKMVRLISVDGAYEIQNGNTLRNDLMKENEYSLTGIMTANIDTWIEEPIDGLSENEVEIDGTIYRISDLSMKNYIGREVNFFAVGKGSGTKLITAISSTDKNKVIKFNADEFDSADSNRIYYYETPEAEKTKYAKYDLSTVFIKTTLRRPAGMLPL